MSRDRATIGIVTALEMERRWIGSTNDTAFVEVGGMGRARAKAAATRLLDRGVKALVSWGIAGGLDGALEPGTVVVPEVVVGADGTCLHADAGWRDRLLSRISDGVQISVEPILHVDEVITSPDQKRELHERRHAAAVDMESYGVATVAQDAGVPWIVIRAVGDAADHEVPRVVTNVSDSRGRLRIVAVLGLVFRPRLWPALVTLGRANAAAGRSMRRVWRAAGPDLALNEDQPP
jgi:adenosylhomocysteine nucleosidase